MDVSPPCQGRIALLNYTLAHWLILRNSASRSNTFYDVCHVREKKKLITQFSK